MDTIPTAGRLAGWLSKYLTTLRTYSMEMTNKIIVKTNLLHPCVQAGLTPDIIFTKKQKKTCIEQADLGSLPGSLRLSCLGAAAAAAAALASVKELVLDLIDGVVQLDGGVAELILGYVLAAQHLPVLQGVRILQILFEVMQRLVDMTQAQVIVLQAGI